MTHEITASESKTGRLGELLEAAGRELVAVSRSGRMMMRRVPEALDHFGSESDFAMMLRRVSNSTGEARGKRHE